MQGQGIRIYYIYKGIVSGEGVSNQNGKGRVALKKISVQNPQNRFPYQNVLVSKKFSEKISGK